MRRDDGFLIMGVAGTWLALDRACVREILFICALERPPTGPPFLSGILDLAGEAVPVLSLVHLLGLAETEPDVHAHIVVAAGAAGAVGLCVDRVRELISGRPTRLLPVQPGATFKNCIAGDLLWRGDRAHVLALDRVLLDAELRALEHFRALEQRRIDELAHVETVL